LSSCIFTVYTSSAIKR